MNFKLTIPKTMVFLIFFRPQITLFELNISLFHSHLNMINFDKNRIFVDLIFGTDVGGQALKLAISVRDPPVCKQTL